MKSSRRDFVELNARTCFSFLRAASQPDEMVETAHQLGYRGIAITDINGFYGMVRAHHKSTQLLFTTHFGVEIELQGHPLILLAKSFKGYSRLCRLISEAYQGRPKGEPQFTQDLVKKWLDPQVMHSLLPATRPTPQNLFSWLREITPLTQLVTQAHHPDQDLPMARWLALLPKEIPRAWTWAFHRAAARLSRAFSLGVDLSGALWLLTLPRYSCGHLTCLRCRVVLGCGVELGCCVVWAPVI